MHPLNELLPAPHLLHVRTSTPRATERGHERLDRDDVLCVLPLALPLAPLRLLLNGYAPSLISTAALLGLPLCLGLLLFSHEVCMYVIHLLFGDLHCCVHQRLRQCELCLPVERLIRGRVSLCSRTLINFFHEGPQLKSALVLQRHELAVQRHALRHLTHALRLLLLLPHARDGQATFDGLATTPTALDRARPPPKPTQPMHARVVARAHRARRRVKEGELQRYRQRGRLADHEAQHRQVGVGRRTDGAQLLHDRVGGVTEGGVAMARLELEPHEYPLVCAILVCVTMAKLLLL
mmetsp:Transcript_773/g.1374  ORF Transcript_773/g.1374 Transcript_773/m.1374 type:complete len:294 (-) Transcript_773:447-1328(-)